MLDKFKPKDLIAMYSLLLIAFLLYTGVDGTLSACGALIIGYYFAHRAGGTDNGI